MTRRIFRLSIWGSVLPLLTASIATAAAPPLFRRAGIAIHPPVGWFVTTEPLNGITDPVQRFVLSSYRVPAGADAGSSYVPPSRAVLAQVVEEVPPSSDGGAWRPRPLSLYGTPAGPDGDAYRQPLGRAALS